jgi:hypothetical protein
VFDIEADVDRQRLQRHARAGRVDPALHGVGARIAVEQVIETAILLDDEHDVFD